MPLAGHLVFLPNQGQRPRKQDRNQKQHADHGERQPDVVLVIEQNPCRKSEPGDEADRGLIDGWMKLIKNWPVVRDKFPDQLHPAVYKAAVGLVAWFAL